MKSLSFPYATKRRHQLLAVFCIICLALPVRNVVANGLFGSTEIASTELSALPQWGRVMNNLAKGEKIARACDREIRKCESQQMTLWRAKIQELSIAEPQEKIFEINRFINKWRHKSDQENYNKADYWATPLEFLLKGGDSEDFAIMKFISLRELEISQKDMRIVVTRDALRNEPHTVLAVAYKGKSYILDSLSDTVVEDEFIKYYVPYYSVNETTRWAHIPANFSNSPSSIGNE